MAVFSTAIKRATPQQQHLSKNVMHIAITALSSLLQTPRYASFYDRRFKVYASKPLHRVSLEHLVKFDLMFNDKVAMLLQSANFLRTTLPVRLARRILDIHALPYICGINPHIQKIHNIYEDIFNQFVQIPRLKSLEDEKKFVDNLYKHLQLSREVLPNLARASTELSPHMTHAALTAFLDTMIESRIGRRVLAEQHIAFHQQYYSPDRFDKMDIGSVSMSCDPVAIAKHVFNRTANIASGAYGCAPNLDVSTSGEVRISYIAKHLEYMLLELFKNAVRATIEHHLRSEGSDRVMLAGTKSDLPSVRLHIYSSADQTIIRISDRGGGIPAHIEPHIWNYAFTTVAKHDIGDNSAVGYLANATPMAGEGFGLPMARIYARYFGGDLTLQNIPSFGAEMFLKLKHLNRENYVKLMGDKLNKDIPSSLRNMEQEPKGPMKLIPQGAETAI